jgi:hypothetical protein
VPGANGIFDVHVDGTLVFTKSMLGRYPEPTMSSRSSGPMRKRLSLASVGGWSMSNRDRRR